MALYQVGDVVNVIDEENIDETILTRITAVLQDVARGNMANLYVGIILAGDSIALNIEFFEEEISELISGPTLDARNANREPIRQLGIDPIENFRVDTVQEARQSARNTNLDALEEILREANGNVIVRRNNSPSRQLGEFGMAFIDTGTPIQREPRQEPPILEVTNIRTFPRLTREFYIPRLNSETIYSFRLDADNNNILLTPSYNDFKASYEYRDAENRVWINRFQNESITRYRTVRDTINVQWILQANFLEGELSRLSNHHRSAILTSKKNLRRKYDKMPEIKEEKYYAGKDYIA